MTASRGTNNPSLVHRIILRLSLVGLISGAVGYGFLFLEFSTLLNGLHDSTLYGEAEYLADHIALDDAGAVALTLPDSAKALYALGERRYRIVADGRPVAESPYPPAPRHELRVAHPGQTVVGFDDLIGVYERASAEPGQYIYGGLVSEDVGGRAVQIQVERTTEHFSLLADTLLDEFFFDGGWVGIPFLVLVGLAIILTILQTLRPLGLLSRQARMIGPGAPAMRLGLGGVPKEVLPLVEAVNGAVERLEQAFDAQRAFTADAAHELRTPLAVLQMRVDGLPPSDIRTALERDIGVMARLVNQLLEGARLETAELAAGDKADLRDVAVAVAEAIAPLAIGRGVDLELEGGDRSAPVRGRHDLLYDALRNLVENALTVTPPGRRVIIRVEVRRLAVIDQGAGILPADRAHLFLRFWQGRRKTGGAGLGLSIVRRVADLHGATVVVEDTPGGGATFSLSFPRPPGTG